MTNKFIAIGDSLGALEVGGSMKYRVKVNDIFELNESLFFVWNTVRKHSHSLKKQLEKLNADEQKDFNELLTKLLEIGLIVDLQAMDIEQLLTTFALFAKGNVVEETDTGYKVSVLRKHDAIDLPIVPYLVWENSHPFVQLKDILELTVEESKLTKQDVYAQFQQWLPLYISTGLASLKPIN